MCSPSNRPSRRFSDRIHRGKNDLDQAQITDVYNYRFQEIVPLVAGNIFGTEDNGPARKWIALVNKTLNSLLGTRDGKGSCCDKVGLKKGRWTNEEDQILINYIQAIEEGSWRALPKNVGFLRCGKSCRLRWINYLRADLKRGNISIEEEAIITKLHASFGNRLVLFTTTLYVSQCHYIIGYSNTDVAEYLYNSKPDADSLYKYLCKDLTKACSTKSPPVPKVVTI
ncbi:hypothetical protein Ahy_A01g003162 [Arachis hypogaea]|uniref:Uncharacterized protein n=1 Tax=Arachis hypogaea TaxID=3818 RepID=A0A445ESK9_ARAHY|nr:hypothetical protein Ahy_A01g003162 [Arachis hypogaea]